MHILFNSELLKRVPAITGKKYGTISQEVGKVSRTTMFRWLKEGDMRFSVFVDLCNIYQLDVWAFFVPFADADRCALNVRMPKSKFRKYSFDTSLLPGYSRMPEFISCKDLAVWMTMQYDNQVCLPLVYEDGERVCKDFGKREAQDAREREVRRAAKSQGDAERVLYTKLPCVYNDELFRQLPAILHVQKGELGQTCGRTQSMYFHAVREQNVTVRALVDVCNHFRINILLFFMDCKYVPIDVVTPKEEWTDIQFFPERLLTAEESMTMRALQRKLGIPFLRLKSITRKENSPLRAQDLVHICNTMKLQPSFFFTQSDEVSYKVRTQADADRRIAQQNEQIERLRMEKALLESKLRHMEAMQAVRKEG